MMTKNQLRRLYLAQRDAMTDSAYKSIRIADRLYACSSKKWKHIFCYLSFGNEVDTISIIRQMLEWGTVVSVPVCNPAVCTMKPAIIDDISNCTKNRYGILEPTQIVQSDLPLDAVLVPGIVFSCSGHRIGFGKGYYDRFLRAVNGNPLKIGLCYDWQLVDEIPHEPHDVTMDLIITDKRVLRL